MITRFRKQVFSLRHTYSNPLDIQRAQVLLIVDVAIVVLAIVTTILLILPTIISTGTADFASLWSTVVVIIAAVVSHRLIQSGRLNAAIWIMLAAIILGTLSGLLFTTSGFPNISSSLIVFLPVPIIAAGVLLNRRALIVVMVLMLVILTAAALAQRGNTAPITTIPAETAINDLTLVAISIIVVSAILAAFLGTLHRIASESFQLITQRQWMSQLGSTLSSATNEADLLSNSLTMIRKSVGQQFVEIYLINEDGNLTLASSSGRRRSAIRSTDSNILAEAARTRTTLTVSLEDDPAWRGHMAASTSYAAAVPIMVNNNLMGILDFQDVVPFSQNELDTLQELADQIALSLQHVRVTTDMKTLLEDQGKTITRLQTQLQDFNRRQQQNVGEVWGDYVQGRGRQAIGYNLEGSTAVPMQATDLPSGLENTLKSGQLDVSTQGSEQIINVPIKFRDTNLGAMSFAVPSDHPLSQRQIEVATTVAERLALALENTRLFEQSQSQALRERKASEVAAALIGATDVRVVLNMAAEQFKDALGAVNTRIYIQPETLMEPLAQPQGEQ
ncbi:MAG: GAF domain-containing protein [Anaerolineae bacterium]|nr:GAF domain-containing protein [Anaerolineae bacterium]